MARLGRAALTARGRAILEAEGAALHALARKLDARFSRAVEAITSTKGRVIVSGIGKAGFVAQKLSATFASTGTPSLYLHPSDALHGDLGRVAPGDLLLALSHSGETEELIRLVPPAKRLGAKVLAITAEEGSSLGKLADLTVPIGVQTEVGLGLAPTTSTTVMLALGDALAMAASERRGFGEAEFHLYHPGGSLGRRLMRVADVMRKGPMVPIVSHRATLRDALSVMTETPGRPGAAMIVDGRRRLVGLFTDGDLRRHLEREDGDLGASLAGAMCKDPRTVSPDQPVREAAALLREHQVDQVPVVDERHRPVGLLDVQDLLALRFL